MVIIIKEGNETMNNTQNRGVWLEEIESIDGDRKLQIQKIEYQTRNFRLPVFLLRQMAEIAQREDISINKLVTLFCEYGVNHMNNTCAK